MKKTIAALLLTLCVLTYNSIPVLAAPSEDDVSLNDAVETDLTDDEIETNSIPNWPAGPELNAEAALLMDAENGVILYAKNIHKHLYPASTTKMMTALIAAESCDLNETVKFSHNAVFSLEAGSSNIGIDPGQAMPLEECLYGIMVASANEVANAVAEHVSGDMDSFVALMNKRAGEFSLNDTHYANANGLFDENHYTSAYDLALVAREFFKNDYLSKIGNTASYHFEATPTQPDDFVVRNKHKLITGEIPYEGVKGGKTGYTSEAGETLVTYAEQNGMKLICVILNEVSPDQFYDTVKLFDYGFSNFGVVNVADNEENYAITSGDFFPTSIDVLGSSAQILELNTKNNIIMPRNITFNDLETELTYDTKREDEVAYINYYYHGAYLGYGTVNIAGAETDNTLEENGISTVNTQISEENDEIEKKPVFINVVYVVYCILGFGVVVVIISFIYSIIVNYNLFESFKRRRSTRRRHRKGGGLSF